MQVSRSIDHKEQFQQNGYTVARQFFSPLLIRQLFAQIRAIGFEAYEGWAGTYLYPRLFERSLLLQELISSQRLVDLLVPIVGPEIRVRGDRAIQKRPGSRESPWHQDNQYSGSSVHHFQLWLPLSRSGGLWLQPGSHRRGLLPEGGERTVGATQHFVCAEPGDVIVFSSFTLHRGAANGGLADHWAYLVEYLPAVQYDPRSRPPYFRVAKNGRSSPQFSRFHPGAFDPTSAFKFLLPRLDRGSRDLVRGFESRWWRPQKAICGESQR